MLNLFRPFRAHGRKKFKSLSSKAKSQKTLTSILNKIHKIVKNEKMR